LIELPGRQFARDQVGRIAGFTHSIAFRSSVQARFLFSQDIFGLIASIVDFLYSGMTRKPFQLRQTRGMQRNAWNKRLLASTRGKILGLLRSEDRTVADLAAALNLTDNAVRAHLLSLERDGLVQQRGLRRGTRKPHAVYRLSVEAEHIFPKAYGPLLNHLVDVMSHRLSARALRATMREVGNAVAQDHLAKLTGRSPRERLKAALDLYHDLGGAAKLTNVGGKQLIHGRDGCPLAAVTAAHPEACLIVESLLSKLIGVGVKKCCQYGEAPRCCFELSGISQRR
jgi:predicted ArsR family transcriptional regulator